MTPMIPHDEQMLVARLSAGETGAFDEVYDAYRPRVFAFLLRLVLPVGRVADGEVLLPGKLELAAGRER